jgi:hypothetical protein
VEYLTLVDEMQNFGKLYYKEGKLYLENKDARKFKEDFHRLRGEKGSTLIYYTEQPLSEFRIFAYASEDQDLPEVSVSVDGNKYYSQPSINKRFFAGKLDYDYIPAVLIQGVSKEKGAHFLRVDYRDKINIGRIEIDYGKK